MDLQTYATHTPFSDPGPHAALVAAVPPDTPSLHRAATQTVLHYRAGEVPPTPDQLDDIDRRWVSATLDAAVDRAPGPLDAPRDSACRVGGCCRDHSLLAISILREHGVPARSRVGFGSYFGDAFHHDHVVVERWVAAQERWVRFDPEFPAEAIDGRAHDLPTGEGAPFETAAEAWTVYRAGRTDLADYGVDPALPALAGPGFVARYVVLELAHRMRHEMLLWDVWTGVDDVVPGAASDGPSEDLAGLVDRTASLLVRADGGDTGAENDLLALWESEDALRPTREVRTYSPSGRVGTTDLASRTTTWHRHGGSLVAP